jgi:hypothetical protein
VCQPRLELTHSLLLPLEQTARSMRFGKESRHRRKDNIQMDLREMVRESVDCVKLALE